MKNVVLVVICTVLLSSGLFAQNLGGEYYVLSQEGLVLRSEPKASAPKMTTVPYGSKVMLLRSTHQRTAMTIDNIPGWYEKVLYDGSIGYLFSGYIVPAFFDIHSRPETLLEALAPWAVDKHNYTIPWMGVHDLWLLLTQAWELTPDGGKGAFPTKPIAIGTYLNFEVGLTDMPAGWLASYYRAGNWVVDVFAVKTGGVRLVYSFPEY